MTIKHPMFDIDLPTDDVTDSETFPAGKVSDPLPRGGPMATVIAETDEPSRERQEIESLIRAENDALAHEHLRLKRLGLIAELVPLDLIQMTKMVRDRKFRPDQELKELKDSIQELGLSNPVRLESRADGGHELVQGYRPLAAYRELLAETGDMDRFGTIPAIVSAPGEGLASLYRRMVDENLVRKDISFAEMAALALDYCADPGTVTNDPDKAVAQLFKSAGYQKRSYIRSFIPVVDRLGPHLEFVEEIPRSLGMALSKRLEDDDGFALSVRDALKGWNNRSVSDELGILRRLLGQDEDESRPAPARPATPFAHRDAKAKFSFQFDRREGRGTCVAASGKLEIQLNRDFTTIDRRRLEQAIRRMLDELFG
jgi:ParB family chromosome partitioning protein